MQAVSEPTSVKGETSRLVARSSVNAMAFPASAEISDSTSTMTETSDSELSAASC